MSNRDIKVERSIPVQGRVDITTLADIAVYLEGTGIRVNSMSMLLSYGMEVAWNALKANDMLERVHEDTLDAHRTLQMLRLYQRSMMHRAKRKVIRSISFDELRKEGTDPRDYAPHEYNRIHNSHSIEYPDRFSRNIGDVEAAKRMFEEERKKMLRETSKGNEKEENIDHLLTDYGKKSLEEKRNVPEVEVFEDAVDKVTNYDPPRKKTLEEIKADEERIAEKDRKLNEELDKTMGMGASDKG